MSEHDAYLVITFVGSTHVLAMNEADELDEATLPGFATDATTLFCGSLDNDHTIQVRARPVLPPTSRCCRMRTRDGRGMHCVDGAAARGCR